MTIREPVGKSTKAPRSATIVTGVCGSRLSLTKRPDDLAAIVPAADIDRQLVRDRRERAFLDQARNESVADLELQILERAVRGREKIGGQAHQYDKGDPGEHQYGLGEREMAQAGRPHDDELALGGQPVEGEQDRDEHADRQHDVEKAGQDQESQIEEYLDRQPAVDDQIDQPKRLGEPDRGAERGGHKHHDAKALAQDVAVEPRHRRRIISSAPRPCQC